MTEAFKKYASNFIEVTNSSSGITLPLRIRSQKKGAQLKKEALSTGLPVVIMNSSAAEGEQHTNLIIYYNQIPLDDIDTVIDRLITRWRS